MFAPSTSDMFIHHYYHHPCRYVILNLNDVFFEEIRLDNGKYCFGIQHVNEALEQGAVENS